MPGGAADDTGTPRQYIVAVVDDDASVRRALARLVQGCGLEVRTFSSAEVFLESAHLDGVGCVLLDVHLGGMSGLELLDRLGAMSSVPSVILITARDTPQARRKADEFGVVAFFRKPVDAGLLLNAIGLAVGRDLGSLA